MGFRALVRLCPPSGHGASWKEPRGLAYSFRAVILGQKQRSIEDVRMHALELCLWDRFLDQTEPLIS